MPQLPRINRKQGAEGPAPIVLGGPTLRGLPRCPQCGVATPEMQFHWRSDCICPPGMSYGYNWCVYRCTTCNKLVMVQSKLGNQQTSEVDRVYPDVPTAAEELPLPVRKFLMQAMESLHAPDGAVMLAGAAVDAMLKDKGLCDGSVYSRIDQAVQLQILTTDMAAWAHSVRLESNRPRHADRDAPHVSQAEAAQAVEFAKTLGHVLFVLPKRVEAGRKAASGELEQQIQSLSEILQPR